MSMSAVFTNFGGMVVHQQKGGAGTELISDPLGSVIKTKDSSGSQTSRTEYWPFGEVQASTGTNPTPFGFVGILGYFKDLANLLYVRARQLRPDLGRWMSVDPLWPKLAAYMYVNSRPSSRVDFSGEFPFEFDWGIIIPGPGGPPDWFRIPWDIPRMVPPIPMPWFEPPSWFWPALPGPGGGKADYNPSGWFLDFGYGNCCGFWRKCNCGDVEKYFKNPNEGRAIDCLDVACAQHDGDNPTFGHYTEGYSHALLCESLHLCSCESMYPDGRDRQNCQDAKMKMAALYCIHGAILPILK